MRSATEQLVYDFCAHVNNREIERLREIVSPEYINHNPQVPNGADRVVEVHWHLVEAFTDFKFTIENVWESRTGSHVFTRARWSGVHEGICFGYPPTGNTLDIHSHDIWKVENGRFTEHWDELDWLAFYQTLGCASKTDPPTI